MDALFILNENGSFIVEKHFRGRVPRTVCEPFLDVLTSGTVQPHLVPKVMSADSRHALLHVYRDKIIFLAVTAREVCPLLVLELLERMFETVQKYFGQVTEESLRSQFSTLYLLLDEMVDGGEPATTDVNILEMLVQAPSVLHKVVETVSGGARALSEMAFGRSGGSSSSNVQRNTAAAISGEPSGPEGAGMGTGTGVGAGAGISGCGSDVWWRKGGLSYAANECWMDVIETIVGAIDGNGRVVHSCVNGEISVNSKLGGIPDCALSLRTPALLEDASFHPCVRIPKFHRDGLLSFCPPDGDFKLAEYSLPEAQVALPFEIKAVLVFKADGTGAQLSVSATTRQHYGGNPNAPQHVVENFRLAVPLPSFVGGATLSQTSPGGAVRFAKAQRAVIWTVPKLTDEHKHNMEGTISYEVEKERGPDGADTRNVKCVALVDFSVKGWAVSGFKVDSLEIRGVNYKPYKGCRYTTLGSGLEFRIDH